MDGVPNKSSKKPLTTYEKTARALHQLLHDLAPFTPPQWAELIDEFIEHDEFELAFDELSDVMRAFESEVGTDVLDHFSEAQSLYQELAASWGD